MPKITVEIDADAYEILIDDANIVRALEFLRWQTHPIYEKVMEIIETLKSARLRDEQNMSNILD